MSFREMPVMDKKFSYENFKMFRLQFDNWRVVNGNPCGLPYRMGMVKWHFDCLPELLHSFQVITLEQLRKGFKFQDITDEHMDALLDMLSTPPRIMLLVSEQREIIAREIRMGEGLVHPNRHDIIYALAKACGMLRDLCNRYQLNEMLLQHLDDEEKKEFMLSLFAPNVPSSIRSQFEIHFSEWKQKEGTSLISLDYVLDILRSFKDCWYSQIWIDEVRSRSSENQEEHVTAVTQVENQQLSNNHHNNSRKRQEHSMESNSDVTSIQPVKKQRQLYKEQGRCFGCGSLDHVRANCPDRHTGHTGHTGHESG